jgi:hypothetical protein
MRKLSWLSIALASTPLFVACQQTTAANAIDVQYPVAYSAYDGVHTFQVPITVNGLNGVQWSVSDPSMVTIAASSTAGQQILTVKKTGSVTYVATVGDLTGSGTLTVTAASADDWTIGQQRYHNGVKFWPGHPDGGSGGMDGGRPMPNHDAACTSCHGADASGGPFKDVEHKPTQTGGYSDQDLITIFTMGKKPDGATYRVVTPERYAMIHHWDMSDAEAKGLVVYLRSLTPMSQGPIDFGGHFGGGDEERGAEGPHEQPRPDHIPPGPWPPPPKWPPKSIGPCDMGVSERR